MLIFKDTKFIKSPFDSEAELEKVVVDNYEYLFGPDSFYLPKTLIKTADGAGTIPDGFAIDIGERKWYVVEAELGHHDVWNHIAKQVSKQVVASLQLTTKQKLEDISAEMYEKNEYTKEKFTSLGITSVNVRKIIRDILQEDPIIGIPIDNIPNDLKDWARQQRHKVKLWIVSKFVELNNSTNVVYEFPEEFKPELDTAQEAEQPTVNAEINRYDVEVIDLIARGLITVGDKLFMTYKPRNGEQKRYEGVVTNDGSIEVLNQAFSSPSYAALAGIQDAGSDRQTVNGWTSWKTVYGKTLAELREQLLNTKPFQ
jgi:Restriction Enzyme Adenine Methylase Associated